MATANAAWVTIPLKELGTGWKTVTPDDPDDQDGNKVWKYDCLVLKNGGFTIETLPGMSTAHAFEEASYECDGQTIAVRRNGTMDKDEIKAMLAKKRKQMNQ